MLRLLLCLLPLIASTLSAAASPASAIPFWQAGKHYEIVENPKPQARSSARLIVVTEFFWYGCPHCYALEPELLNWQRRMPTDVRLARVAVGWDRAERIAHAKLFYVLQKLGRPDLHQAVFDTIHRDRNRLFVANDEAQTLKAQQSFASSHGIDPVAFATAFDSKEASAYVESANAHGLAARITGVPSISVEGRYTTDVGRAGGTQELFRLVDFLVQQVREEKAVGGASLSQR